MLTGLGDGQSWLLQVDQIPQKEKKSFYALTGQLMADDFIIHQLQNLGEAQPLASVCYPLVQKCPWLVHSMTREQMRYVLNKDEDMSQRIKEWIKMSNQDWFAL